MYMSTCMRNENCHQQSYGFESFMSTWGRGQKFKNHCRVTFLFLGLKVRFLISPPLGRPIFAKKYPFFINCCTS